MAREAFSKNANGDSDSSDGQVEDFNWEEVCKYLDENGWFKSRKKLTDETEFDLEDPKTFIPSPGKITQFHSPCGLGIRIESCVYSGYVVPPYYDSLIAKLIVHASDRELCILRLKQALKEIVIEPISTTIDLHKNILETSVMKEGSYDIRWLENNLLNYN